jgi:Na+/H+ antiporter NhaD/arsenite permease-like protein
VSNRLKYATLGVLFVNVSIGGTLTHFAAPPVLMVAAKWGWTSGFMLSTFGAKAIFAVLVNAVAVTLLFRRELSQRARGRPESPKPRVPAAFVLVNVSILAAVVFTNHYPEAFMGLLLLFLGLAEAYRRHHDRLLLREGLMVAFFLAGLVVLGGQQQWWLQDVLSRLDETTLFYGATALTAITDNAALTYLGSLVEGVSEEYKYALVAGAVAGGGMTVIANAPNPAGYAILKDSFPEGAISAGGLVVAAAIPTLVAAAAFLLLPG